jgi:nucleoside-diphosphate-sugar epimerase
MLGWEPAIPLREGVSRTIEYFRLVLAKEVAAARA